MKSSLRLDESILIVSWRLDEGDGKNREVFLRVPVPRVLIDPECSINVNVMCDHIEAKLFLLLPVDHPVTEGLSRLLGADSDQRVPLLLGSDIENLSSEGVNFFCKSCSTKLTRKPVRYFMEMPSMNWREVADNWFGACCCSFGGSSEKLVSKYFDNVGSTEEICMLDKASIVVHKHLLEGYSFQAYCGKNLSGDNLGRTPLDPGVESSKMNDSIYMCCESVSRGEFTVSAADNVDSPSMVHGDQLIMQNGYHRTQVLESMNEMTSKNDFPCCNTGKTHNASLADGRSESEDSNTPYITLQSRKAYGNGFMIISSNHSSNVNWVEFSCKHCTSPLGSYPSAQNLLFPADGGIRLFKCYISTSLAIGGSNDAFKMHTLERIVANLLLEGSQDELSFRNIIIDLRTKSPRLQIVLLNSNAWCFSGHCVEGALTIEHSAICMRPVVKFLFSDFSASTEAFSKIEEWSARIHTEEVYMMTREIEELTTLLKSSIAKLPRSCSSFQGMSLSFLER
ncbi:hypothetical protein HPP92_011628 [Vanilla planifolia]|uniref:Ubiquitin-conjugating enzyme E2C-binding protein n=1 Tax=Vanilla planifolia TaxID=51239 RepID=A0A835QW15_VANPL|nr:hypothetical protein HPP92_011628 [Vanilla planifolia]